MDDSLNFETRALKFEDLTQIQQLYKDHNKQMSVLNLEFYQVYFDDRLFQEYLNPENKKKCLYGTFLNGELILSMGVLFWQTLPSCTFLRLVGKKHAFEGKSFREPFRKLFGHCLLQMELLGYNRFYILTAAKHHGVLAYFGATWLPFQQKYIMAVEEVIPSHSRSQYDFFWDLMGQKSWPVPVVVRSGTLQNQLRNFDRNQVSKKAIEIWNKTMILPENLGD